MWYVSGVAQNLVELAIAQVGIPFRNAHLLLDHELRQVATDCVGGSEFSSRIAPFTKPRMENGL